MPKDFWPFGQPNRPAHDSVDLGDVLRILVKLDERIHRIMAVLDDLTAQVNANNAGIDSAIALIAGLRQAIIDAGTDPTKLQALVDALAAKDAELAAAVVAPPA